MPFELKNAKITHISLVDKGANGVPFAIIKEHGAQAIKKSIAIAKSDTVRQIVYGVVYAPDVVDAHGDMMTIEEIEKAAHGFMEAQHTHNIDKQHDLQTDQGYVIESYVAPCDMQLGEQTITKGSWVVGVKVTDTDTWSQIEKGEITGFSMWGVGQRIAVEETPSATGQDDVVKGFFHALAKFFGKETTKPATISKAVQSFKSRMEMGNAKDKFWDARWAFTDTLSDIMSDSTIEDKVSAVGQTIDEFKTVAIALLSQMTTTDIETIGKSEEEMLLISKAGKAISSGNMKHIDDAISTLTELKSKVAPKEEQEEEDEVKTEDIAKAVAAAMAPISKQVQDLTTEIAQLKKESGVDDGEQPATGEPVATPEQTALIDAITKALAPITQQMESLASDVQLIKDSRGGTLQPPNEGPIEKSQGGVSFTGLL